jgi:Aspartyl protease
MKLVPVLIFGTLACLEHVQSATAADAGTDCQLKQLASFDMVFERNYIVLPVTLNETSARMLLDINGSKTIVDRTAVTDMKLLTTMLRVPVKYGNTVLDRTVKMPLLTIGGVRYRGFEFFVSPDDKISQTHGLDLAGVLGMDLFEGVDLELDFINRKVALYSQDHCPGKVVYWAHAWGAVPIQRGPLGNIYFPMELDGKKIETSLSTGATVTSLRTDITRRVYGFDEHSPDIQTEFDGAGKPKAQYRAMALKAGDLTVLNANVRLQTENESNCHIIFSLDKDHAAGYDCVGPIPLHLGMNVLQHLHLYLATKEKMLYFTGPDPVTPPPQNSDAGPEQSPQSTAVTQ